MSPNRKLQGGAVGFGRGNARGDQTKLAALRAEAGHPPRGGNHNQNRAHCKPFCCRRRVQSFHRFKHPRIAIQAYSQYFPQLGWTKFLIVNLA